MQQNRGAKGVIPCARHCIYAAETFGQDFRISSDRLQGLSALNPLNEITVERKCASHLFSIKIANFSFNPLKGAHTQICLHKQRGLD